MRVVPVVDTVADACANAAPEVPASTKAAIKPILRIIRMPHCRAMSPWRCLAGNQQELCRNPMLLIRNDLYICPKWRCKNGRQQRPSKWTSTAPGTIEDARDRHGQPEGAPPRRRRADARPGSRRPAMGRSGCLAQYRPVGSRRRFGPLAGSTAAGSSRGSRLIARAPASRSPASSRPRLRRSLPERLAAASATTAIAAEIAAGPARVDHSVPTCAVVTAASYIPIGF